MVPSGNIMIHDTAKDRVTVQLKHMKKATHVRIKHYDSWKNWPMNSKWDHIWDMWPLETNLPWCFKLRV